MAAPAIVAAAASRSASASTIEAFWPPISHCAAAPRSTAIRATARPVSTDPVNGHRGDARVPDERRACIAAPLHEPAARASGSSGARHSQQRLGARGRIRRRLPHARVAVGERRRELPCRDGDGEVPGRDQRHDAPRPPPREEQRAAVGRRVGVAVGIERRLGLVAQDRGRAGDLRARFDDRLSDLAADEVGEAGRGGLDPRRRAVQGIRARLPRQRGVAGRGRARGRDRPVDVDAAAGHERADCGRRDRRGSG